MLHVNKLMNLAPYIGGKRLVTNLFTILLWKDGATDNAIEHYRSCRLFDYVVQSNSIHLGIR